MTLNWIRCRPRLLPSLVALAAVVICFFQLGDHGVRLWDETRHGESAWQMLRRGDFINYYFDGLPDDWLAKPPLGVWLIALSYKLIGFNEWALRTPSALAGVGIVMLTYSLVRLYHDQITAALTCMILLLCRGIVGQHVSRTGDLDALFIVTAMAMIYLLQRHEKKGDALLLLLAGVCGGLCFFTKGFMMGLFLPGLGLYVLLRGRALTLLKNGAFWGALVIFLGFISGWYLAVKKLGTPFVNSRFGADSWDVMVNYDIFRRFTEKIEGDTSTPLYLLEALDIRFGPWLYLLIVSLPLLLWKRENTSAWWRAAWCRLKADHLTLLSVCMVVPTCMLFASSATKFNWYVAITTPFLSVLTLQLFQVSASRWPCLRWLFGVFTLVGIGGQLQYLLGPEESLSHQVLVQLPAVREAKHIYAERKPAYNTILTLKWRDRQAELASAEVMAKPREKISSKVARIAESDGGFSLLLMPAGDD